MMAPVIRLLVAAACVLLLCYVIYLVSRERLLLKYSLLWLLLAIVVSLCAIFPDPVFTLARLCGFTLSSNFIFMLGIFFLMLIGLSLSVIVSKQVTSVKNLTQRLAIVEKELLDLTERRN